MDDARNKKFLEEFDSLRQILFRNKPLENNDEREALIMKVNTIKEMASRNDSESVDVINSGVVAMEKAVEAFLQMDKNNLREKETNDILPEMARPFQPISFDQKKPLSIQQVLSYLDQENQAITQMPYKPKSGEVILFKAKTAKHRNDWRSTGQRWHQINGGSTLGGSRMQKFLV